jgi:hypothetical protein
LGAIEGMQGRWSLLVVQEIMEVVVVFLCAPDGIDYRLLLNKIYYRLAKGDRLLDSPF